MNKKLEKKHKHYDRIKTKMVDVVKSAKARAKEVEKRQIKEQP